MDNDDKGFQVTIFEQHANWYIMIEEWPPCNDMGNVDHLPTYLPFYLFPTSHLITCLLPTSYSCNDMK
jgi:hypothetical protein